MKIFLQVDEKAVNSYEITVASTSHSID